MELRIYYGRGGWTWYTGSSSWYYKCGIEDILGMKIKNKELYFEPCIPKDWNEYSIQYKYGESIYNIKVRNISKNKEVEKIYLNGINVESKKIKLENNGRINEVEVII